MGCAEDCPFFVGVKVEDWAVEDPSGKPAARVRQVRDDIFRRVKTMIEIHGWGRSEIARTGTRG
jgi:arsenate reductase